MQVKQISMEEALALKAQGKKIGVSKPVAGKDLRDWESYIPTTIEGCLKDCIFFRIEEDGDIGGSSHCRCHNHNHGHSHNQSNGNCSCGCTADGNGCSCGHNHCSHDASDKSNDSNDSNDGNDRESSSNDDETPASAASAPAAESRDISPPESFCRTVGKNGVPVPGPAPADAAHAESAEENHELSWHRSYKNAGNTSGDEDTRKAGDTAGSGDCEKLVQPEKAGDKKNNGQTKKNRKIGRPRDPEKPSGKTTARYITPTKQQKIIDLGKIGALYRAKWPAAKIADEMGINPNSIYYYIKKALEIEITAAEQQDKDDEAAEFLECAESQNSGLNGETKADAMATAIEETSVVEGMKTAIKAEVTDTAETER